MNIIVKRAILYYIDKYPMSNNSLITWYNEFSDQEFRSFNELKEVYGSASIVSQNRVIFNVKGNDFRLIVSINFKQKAGYIIWFGTHEEYNRIDATKVKFNNKILMYKPS